MIDGKLFILLMRIVSALILYAFLLGVVWIIWRDWRSVAKQVAKKRETNSRTWGRLLVIEAGETDLVPDETFAISVVTSLGRASSNSVIVQDAFASSQHAMLSFRDGRWWLQDLGSRNGTLLNEEYLNAPAIVTTGDMIGIGKVRLRIELSMPE